MRYRKTLIACYIISLGFHAFAIGFLQRYSLWFSSPPINPPVESLTLIDKDEVLKSTFETILSPAPKTIAKPVSETTQITIRSSIPIPEPEHQIAFNSSFSMPPHDFSPLASVSHNYSIPLESFNLLEHLPKELIIPVSSKPTATPHLPIPMASSLTLKSAPQNPPKEAPPLESPPMKSVDIASNFKPEIAKPSQKISFPNLPKLPTLAELQTSSYSDSFDAELTFLPKETGGYIFALTLIPHPDLSLPKIRQHFTFLIDRSNSIQQGRLTATKSALHKAFEELSPEDTFNIIA